MERELCQCGCGGKTNIATRNSTRDGLIKGKPKRFIAAHYGRKHVRYKINDDGCWIWCLSKNYKGYGQVRKNGKLVNAHRLYYEEASGKIPEGLQVDHLCRNRACVNPDHLEVVTSAENVRRGDVAKLSMEKAIKIRKMYKGGKFSNRKLGVMFGVTRNTIWCIIHNKTYKVTDYFISSTS